MILQTQDIVKKFGGLVAVSDVSLGVEDGEIFGLIGPNGAGKTTLLNVIAGVYKPDGGIVTFNGEEITGLSSTSICWKGIARTFQISRPFPKMTALENVLVAATFGNRIPADDPQTLAEEMLKFVEFPMPKDTPAENLNTIQLKRLDVARALASKPSLLLLDEMAAGLTPGELMDAIELIRKIRMGGITIIVVEHVMKVIMTICDRIAVLEHGEKIAEGTPDEIQKDERVTEAYLGAQSLLSSKV
jgi:branched-chain amino acid transport system ATP-binding protein